METYFVAFVFSKFVQQTNETWIGLHIHKGESELHWSDQTPLDYQHWNDGKMIYPKKNSVMCISQVFSQKIDGRWAARNCTAKLPFTCKISQKKAVTPLQYKHKCFDDWTMYDKMCYKYFTYPNGGSWPMARENCKRFGGDLATVNTKEIQSIIYHMVRTSFAAVWIGKVSFLILFYSIFIILLFVEKIEFDCPLSRALSLAQLSWRKVTLFNLLINLNKLKFYNGLFIDSSGNGRIFT